MTRARSHSSATPNEASIRESELVLARRASRRTCTGVVLALILAGMWAAWPLRAPAVPNPPSLGPDHQAPESPVVRPLSAEAFNAQIWTLAAIPEPPPPPPAPVPPPLPPALRLQLLGIVRESDASPLVFKAALYDPDTDTIVMVSSGDTVGGRTIKDVLADRVLLALGSTVQTLTLREDLTSISAGPARKGKLP